MATQTRMPQPPLPQPSSSFYRRHRVASSSSSSSLSTASSTTSSPSPSPHSTATTSVPFSWEHHPGIPKTCLPANPASPPTPLPLPPPLRAPPSRHHHRRRRRRASPPPGHAVDPFAAALAECTKERPVASGTGGNVIGTLFPTPASGATGGRAGRRWSIAAGGVDWFLDLYGCKSAMAVAEGAFIVRRPVAVARPGPGRPGQGRPGRAGRQ